MLKRLTRRFFSDSNHPLRTPERREAEVDMEPVSDRTDRLAEPRAVADGQISIKVRLSTIKAVQGQCKDGPQNLCWTCSYLDGRSSKRTHEVRGQDVLVRSSISGRSRRKLHPHPGAATHPVSSFLFEKVYTSHPGASVTTFFIGGFDKEASLSAPITGASVDMRKLEFLGIPQISCIQPEMLFGHMGCSSSVRQICF